MSMGERDSTVERITYEAAAAQGLGVVNLEFGRSATSQGPRACSIALPDGAGGYAVVRDCALVETDDGRCVVVPRGAGASDRHFAIGPAGLEERIGRPASLAAGMAKAARRLKAASKTADRSGTRLTVTDLDMAA